MKAYCGILYPSFLSLVHQDSLPKKEGGGGRKRGKCAIFSRLLVHFVAVKAWVQIKLFTSA